MKASIREKLDVAKAAQNMRAAEELQIINTANAIADQIVDSGEKHYSLAWVAGQLEMHETTVSRKLRGRPGYLQFNKGGSVRITDTLYRQFIAEAARTGLR